MSIIQSKHQIGASLFKSAQGLTFRPESSTVKHQTNKVRSLKPIDTNGLTGNVGGQNITFRILPNSVKGRIYKTDLDYNCQITGTPGTLSILSVSKWIESYRLYSGNTSVPLMTGTGQSDFFVEGALHDEQEREGYTTQQQGWFSPNQYNLSGITTVRPKVRYQSSMDQLNHFLSQINTSDLKEDLILVINLQPEGIIQVGSGMNLEWNTNPIEMIFHYHDDPLWIQQITEASKSRDVSINYTSVQRIVKTVNIPANDQDFQVEIPRSNEMTYMSICSVNDGSLFNTPWLDVDQSDTSFRIDLVDHTNNSVLGTAIPPILLLTDYRLPSKSVTFFNSGSGWVYFIPFLFSESPIDSFNGKMTGFHKYEHPHNIRFISPDINAGSYNVDIYNFNHHELHFNYSTGEFKKIY